MKKNYLFYFFIYSIFIPILSAAYCPKEPIKIYDLVKHSKNEKFVFKGQEYLLMIKTLDEFEKKLNANPKLKETQVANLVKEEVLNDFGGKRVRCNMVTNFVKGETFNFGMTVSLD